ncbi:hypothetical protein DFH27DRAFT_26759 [Peziza echinospora]|nr:hypothetical protein DFH27DRAFT_26759 [Peziza echinospora]
MTTTTDTNGGGGMPGSPPSRQNLTSWWKTFSKKGPRQGEKEPVTKEKSGIFGVPLHQSIDYANVAISLTDANGNSFIYGYVPIVVAKCGVFLKEKATDVEGIFRLSGSSKRIKDLQNTFNSPEKYGKGLDWTGYTVHDAANVLRRYLNQLPEPIIPLEFYDRFRAPLALDTASAIRVYQQLISELPPLNRQLLLYILDLLAVFASKSEQNLMTSQNLSAIFQPGLISHPIHDMSPEDYRISQDVLVFLIEHQDHFLLGMRGAADEDAGPLQNSAPHTPTSRTRTGNMVSRSASNASAAADDLRKNGGIRRNVSVSSKKSTPGSPKIGVSRSNTVPSKRSPGSRPTSFKPAESASSPTLATTAPSTVVRAPSSGGHMVENVSPATPTAPNSRRLDIGSIAPTGSRAHSAGDGLPVTTPPATKDRNIANLFLSPGSDSEKGKPNKLKKRRLPGSANHSAESSTTSLPSNTPAAHQTLETVPQSPTRIPKRSDSGPNSKGEEKASSARSHGNKDHGTVDRKHDSSTHINFAHQVPPSVANPAPSNQPHSAASSGTMLAAISPSHSISSSLSSEHESPSDTITDNRRRRSRWSLGKIDNPPQSPPLGPLSKPPPIPESRANHRSANPSPKRDRSHDAVRDKREPSGSDGAGSGSGEDGKGPLGAFGWLQKKMSERSERRHHQRGVAAAEEVADFLGHNHPQQQQAPPPPPPPPPHPQMQAHPSSTNQSAKPSPAPSQIQIPPPSLQLPNRKADATAITPDVKRDVPTYGQPHS